MSVTISDIAKESGVSLATVSRVINNSGYVKDKTRERVIEVIDKYNYTPSAIARSLSKNITNTIGVIVPDITNPFFGSIIKGISDAAEIHNLNLILCDSNESIDKEIKAIKTLKEQRIRGIIICPTSVENDLNSEYLKAIKNLGIPVILVDGSLKHHNFSGVFVDNIKGSYNAIEALIHENHSNIAIITGRMTSKPAQDRLFGYKKALLKNNIPIDDSLIFYGNYKEESGYECTKKILKLKNRPSAIFVCNNLMTLGSLKALREANLKLSKDISLISFDNVPILDSLGINLSHINGPTRELGEISMDLLMESLNKDSKKDLKSIVITPKLILKGSEKLKK